MTELDGAREARRDLPAPRSRLGPTGGRPGVRPRRVVPRLARRGPLVVLLVSPWTALERRAPRRSRSACPAHVGPAGRHESPRRPGAAAGRPVTPAWPGSLVLPDPHCRATSSRACGHLDSRGRPRRSGASAGSHGSARDTAPLRTTGLTWQTAGKIEKCLLEWPVEVEGGVRWRNADQTGAARRGGSNGRR